METILVNPKKRRKRTKKNVEELLLVNPKRKKKRARKNLEEGLFLLNPRRKRRRAKRNPLGAGVGAKSVVGALVGGMLQGITERVLQSVKTKDGNEMIPAPIRTAAFPVVAYLLSGSLPMGKEIALGSIGAAGEKVGTQLMKMALPQSVKTKLGLSGTEEEETIPELQGLSDDDKEFIRQLIPYILEYKDKVNTALPSLPKIVVRAINPSFEPVRFPDQNRNRGSIIEPR
jgi:hypothetical protein